jgi:disulfide bond formation protein DsbB
MLRINILSKFVRSDQKILIFSFLASLSALLIAYISEFFFHLKPCQLCYYQRIPFFLIIFFSLLILFFGVFSKIFDKKLTKKTDLIFLLLFISNFIIASYHFGVEKKIFSAPSTCSSEALNNIGDIAELEILLKSAPAVNCSQPAFVFLNISFAGWNAIYCFFSSLIIIFLLRKNFNDNC